MFLCCSNMFNIKSISQNQFIQNKKPKFVEPALLYCDVTTKNTERSPSKVCQLIADTLFSHSFEVPI